MKLPNKKNLRKRISRLHLLVNSISKYSIGIQFMGSLKKGAGEIIEKPNGIYDIYVIFFIKTNDSAEKVRKSILNDITQNLWDYETINNDLKRGLIRINVYRDDTKYNYDIIIKKNRNISTVSINEDGAFKWK